MPKNTMILKNAMTPKKHWKLVWMAAAVAAVLAIAVFLRIGAFWDSHIEMTEVSYAVLAMKKGSHPAMTGYHMEGVAMRESQSAEFPLKIATPVMRKITERPSFAAWTILDSNPFHYKPPFFPALLAFSHHQILGGNFLFYPLSMAPLDTAAANDFETRKAFFKTQGWAVLVPFVSGIAAVLLTMIAGWRMFGLPAGIAAGFLTAIYPANVLVSSRIWPEATLTTCLLTAFLLVHRFCETKNPAGCILAGGVWAFAALTDSAAFFFLPALAAWVFWTQKTRSVRYVLAFAVSAALIYKSWPDHVHRYFQDSVFRRADISATQSAGWIPGVMPAVIEAAVLWLVPAAAVAATVIFLKRKPWRGGESERRAADSIAVIWLCVACFAAARWLYSPGAPWDARALAPLVPFLAILAVQRWRVRP